MAPLAALAAACLVFAAQWQLCAWAVAVATAPPSHRLPSILTVPPEARAVHSQAVCSIGSQPFDAAAMIKAELQRILEAYGRRPNGNNEGGTKLFHASYLWIIVKWLRPRHIIEVGAFQGAGTWLLREACGDCQITVVTPRMPGAYRDRRPDSVYFTDEGFRDFRDIEWEKVIKSREARENGTFVFFDDHHAHIPRLREARRAGFSWVSFDDNAMHGQRYWDCSSLKQACDPEGLAFLEPAKSVSWSFREDFNRVVRSLSYGEALEQFHAMLRLVDFYMEFPPWWMAAAPKYTYCPECNRSRLMHRPIWSMAEASEVVAPLRGKQIDYYYEANGFYFLNFMRLQT